MDILVRGIPDSATEKTLEAFFKPALEQFSIVAFNCNKFKRKPLAILTIADGEKATRFLQKYGDSRREKLIFHHRQLTCTVSNRAPNEMIVKSVRYAEKKIEEKLKKSDATRQPNAEKRGPQRRFEFTYLQCGVWTDHGGSQTAFVPKCYDSRPGTIMFGKNSVAFMLHGDNLLTDTCLIDIPYWTVNFIVTGSQGHPAAIFTLRSAPKVYQMNEGLNNFTLATDIYQKNTRTRVCAIDKAHEDFIGSCWVYRITLNPSEVSTLHHLLNRNPGMPSATRSVAHTIPHIVSEPTFDTLRLKLLPPHQSGNLPFSIVFQVERLARNGYLTPAKVMRLLPRINHLWREMGVTATTMAIRMLSREMEYLGPDMDPEKFRDEYLSQELSSNAGNFELDGSIYDVKLHSHMILVHRVLITPAGTYLEGPEPETSNRVLRKYPNRTDYFIRVQFADEDGDPIRFEHKTNMEDIYRGRFQKVLDGVITIGGRRFEFLGFSHSSLRAQTCWFMAPFVYNGSLIAAKEVIKGLGDFSHFRSPAKCAARIGQAFSDTATSVTLNKSQLWKVQDVVRNDRTFSDGVGTISESLLEDVLKNHAPSLGRPKPTCLQIRLGGAKGMVSLFTPHVGKKMILRESMIKFRHVGTWDIEVCGANFRPLPMYLNRPFIKILEDLGVPAQTFLDLQKKSMEQLRLITSSPTNAAKFLEHCKTGQAARLPYLLRSLDDIGLPGDEFLNKVVEVSMLTYLRDLKYRARIFVEKGVTLYGIMDETDYLKEGQVYCVYEKAGGTRTVLDRKVLVTRSPAMHPGDFQFATAVSAPPSSPLNALNNCIVFSQKGERDLPSQLSGGDLDGDLYNVIWDTRLMPPKVMKAADYHRIAPVDIGRPVKERDMTSFFVKFMETDQLGRISMIHMQLADRKDNGTLDPACIKLAEMASQAVDFSKTGIAVDMRECPKYDMIRPDFMAPGPRVSVEGKEIMFRNDDDEDDQEVLETLNPDFKTYSYYESERVLGQLYRSIDERGILRDIQAAPRQHAGHTHDPDLMDEIWSYVMQEAQLIQWEEYKPLAREIRDTYESNMIDTMCYYSTHPHCPLLELEVFGGSIIGRSAHNHRTREMATAMRERFERDVSYAVDRITRGDDGDKHEALARAIACLSVSLEQSGETSKGIGELRSWKYVTAAVCLREVELFQRRYDPFGIR